CYSSPSPSGRGREARARQGEASKKTVRVSRLDHDCDPNPALSRRPLPGGEALMPAKGVLFEFQNPAGGIFRELLGMRNHNLGHAFTIQFAHDIEYLVDEPRIQL